MDTNLTRFGFLEKLYACICVSHFQKIGFSVCCIAVLGGKIGQVLSNPESTIQP